MKIKNNAGNTILQIKSSFFIHAQWNGILFLVMYPDSRNPEMILGSFNFDCWLLCSNIYHYQEENEVLV